MKAFLLYPESVPPDHQIAGAIFFPRKKDSMAGTLHIQIGHSTNTGMSSTSSIAVQIPFTGDEILRP